MAKKHKKKSAGGKIVNKRARFEYEILETIEAGMVLSGPEVKSIRLGHGSLSEAFVRVRGSRAYLHNMQITPYKFADNREYEPKQTRSLLMHKHQALSLESKLDTGNYSLIPLEIYPKKGKFKLAVALARGKKQFEKRATIRQRDLDREVEREMRGR